MRAWADLAYTRQNSTQYGGDPVAVGPKALAEAQRAVEIDPNDAGAHATLGYVLVMQGEFGRSEAEFDKALQLNPGDADILAEIIRALRLHTGALSAAAFEAADRAIRLNPNYQVWQGFQFSWAYFGAGRYEDALRILERLPKDKFQESRLGPARRELRRTSVESRKAKAAAANTLARSPSSLTIEGFMGTPDWTDADRKRFVEPMRAAGFPVCAPPRDPGEKPAIGAPTGMPVKMNSARRFSRNDAFFASTGFPNCDSNAAAILNLDWRHSIARYELPLRGTLCCLSRSAL